MHKLRLDQNPGYHRGKNQIEDQPECLATVIWEQSRGCRPKMVFEGSQALRRGGIVRGGVNLEINFL